MRYRFPKSARLTRVAEFNRVKSEGNSCQGRFLVLSVLKNLSSMEIRTGLITSKRLGGAVERNRVRRRLREIVRMSRPKLQPGLWLVLIARRHAVDAPFELLQREWLQLAQRASILAGNP